jgi:hypothetical protein
MDRETITLSGKELGRLRTVDSALAGRITNAEGARSIGMSVRQFIRLRARVAKEGPLGVIHKSRGKTSNHRLPDSERERIKLLLATTYAGFNDTHAAEMLRERDGVTACRETVRSLRIEAGLGAVRRRRGPKHRSRRDRRDRAGTMLLLDGSTHAWFGERAGNCTLLGAIDDATGQVVALRFEPTEDLVGYLELFATILLGHGVPASIYTDKHGVFFVNRAQPSIEEQLAGEEPLSQFGRAVDELGIVRIYSLSPQARGRVERLWGTLQDRLVSELRLEGVSSIDEANAFLGCFVPRFNERFGRLPAEDESDWLAAPADLDWFLCAKYPRAVAQDNTVRCGDRLVDIPPGPRRCSYAKARIELHELRDGRVRIVHDGQVIAEQPPSEDFTRLRCRNTKPLTGPGQLPVAVLPHRACPVCNHERTPISATG